jgi:hypothetical protein
MDKKKSKGMPAFKTGVEYADVYMLPASKEMKAAMAQHVCHNATGSRHDGMTLPYSKMDAKHKGDR